MPPKISLLKRTQGKTIKALYEKFHFLQDILLPLSSLEKALALIENELRIYPIWLCPFVLDNLPGMLHHHNNRPEMYVDVGIYGNVVKIPYDAKTKTRQIEQFLRDERGYQMLYADCYMSEGEFREMFDHALYDKMRKTLDCASAFPEVYHKINRTVRV